MYGNVYPTKYMGKTTDTFGRLKFGCHKTYCFKSKVMLQVEQATQELLMLVLDLKLDYHTWKILEWKKLVVSLANRMPFTSFYLPVTSF